MPSAQQPANLRPTCALRFTRASFRRRSTAWGWQEPSRFQRAVACADTSTVHPEPLFVVRRCSRECADSPPVRMPAQTSGAHRSPRARESFMRRAAGLLRRQRCGPVRGADAPPATEALSAAAGRAPGLCPGITRGSPVTRGSSASTPGRRSRQRHHARVRLTIGEPQLDHRQIDVLPAQLEESALAASG